MRSSTPLNFKLNSVSLEILEEKGENIWCRVPAHFISCQVLSVHSQGDKLFLHINCEVYLKERV
ncbi:Uncharacterised protein [Chlamydia trachomatis]|nr:Uncharacterised protein [Chlamydia trachomatis]